jgi:hypothetical protein
VSDDPTGMLTIGQHAAEHGLPVRVRTGVLTDEDGHQVTIEWWFADGSIYCQVFQPMPEREAIDTSRQIARAIRHVFTIEPETT